MTTILLAMLIFGLAIIGLSVGVIIANSPLSGSCGGVAKNADGGCGVCSKRAANVCPTEAPLVAIAQFTHPDPKHHRG